MGRGEPFAGGQEEAEKAKTNTKNGGALDKGPQPMFKRPSPLAKRDENNKRVEPSEQEGEELMYR